MIPDLPTRIQALGGRLSRRLRSNFPVFSGKHRFAPGKKRPFLYRFGGVARPFLFIMGIVCLTGCEMTLPAPSDDPYLNFKMENKVLVVRSGKSSPTPVFSAFSGTVESVTADEEATSFLNQKAQRICIKGKVKRQTLTGCYTPAFYPKVSSGERVKAGRPIGLFYSFLRFYITSENDGETFLNPEDYGVIPPEQNF